MKVLFVCTGNTCRSPMAEFIARYEAKKRGIGAEFSSAGLAPGVALSEGARAAVRELTGAEPEGHQPRRVTKQMFDGADLVIGLTQDHAGMLRAVFGDRPGLIAMPEDVPDPFGGDADEYRSCAEAIREGIARLMDGGVIRD